MREVAEEFTNTSVHLHKVTDAESGQRIDNFIRRRVSFVNYGTIQKWIRGGNLRVNGKRVAGSYRINTLDVVRIPPVRVPKSFDDESDARPKLTQGAKDFMKDLVIFSNDKLVFINKPAGLASQGGLTPASDEKGGVNRFWTLDRMLGAYDADDMEDDDLGARLVHRLDLDTSGVMVIARGRKVAGSLMHDFKDRAISKLYLAVLAGSVKDSAGQIVTSEEPSSDGRKGKTLRSRYKVLQAAGGLTLVAFFPISGRKHQLRLHAMELGAKILGDRKVAGEKTGKSLALHSCAIMLPSRWGVGIQAASVPDKFREALRGFTVSIPDQEGFGDFAGDLLADFKKNI